MQGFCKLHFFEIIEQRGSVRNGIVEFQVKLKAAVDMDVHLKRKNG